MQAKGHQPRQKLQFPQSEIVKKRIKKDRQLLEGIAGETIQIDEPEGGGATSAEAFRTRIWFSTDFVLDCRKADFSSQVAARLRQHIAELSEIAERIETAAKRRRKVAKRVRISA